jgi:hypothetical protein
MVNKRSHKSLFLALASAIIIIVAFMLFTLLGSQDDLGVASGVKAGDEFTYGIKGFWSSQDSEISPSKSVLESNMTEWYRVTVTGVSGAEVSINTTWRFNNGTELDETGTIDLETGDHYPSGGFWAIYTANLMAGDYVRHIGTDRSTVNQTYSQQYASGTREINRVSLVLEYYDANDPTNTRTLTKYMYINFDRQTGILVELREISIFTNPELTLTLVWTIKDTNVWNVS